jgi:hypothetical protein
MTPRHLLIAGAAVMALAKRTVQRWKRARLLRRYPNRRIPVNAIDAYAAQLLFGFVPGGAARRGFEREKFAEKWRAA